MTDRPAEESPGVALVVRSVSKHYGSRKVLDSLDLDIAAGEIHALLGQNGSGKSTLIKVLSGYHEPDSGGSVVIRGQELAFGVSHSSYVLGCRVVHQDLGLVDDMAVLDNVLLTCGYPSRLGTVRYAAARRRVRGALAQLGLDVDERSLVGKLSPNQKTGVAVARALLADPEHPTTLLVLDEPTATFPEAEVAHLHSLVRRVAASGVGVLYVTHRLDEVPQLCDRVSVLRNGHLVATRSVDSISRPDLISLMIGSELEDATEASAELEPGAGEPALVVDGISSPSLHHVSFDARPGEIVGIAGITGSGRESILEAVFGASPRTDGRVVVAGMQTRAGRPDLAVKAGVGFVPADRKRLGGMMSMTATENIMITDPKAAWRWPVLRRSIEREEARKWMSTLEVRPAGGERLRLQTFSGGNQQKIVLAKWLRRLPRVLLVNEPTQGVDVGARAIIHRSLVDAAQSGAAVVIASTDIDELVAVCQRVVVMSAGRVACEIAGDALTVAAVSRGALQQVRGSVGETALA